MKKLHASLSGDGMRVAGLKADADDERILHVVSAEDGDMCMFITTKGGMEVIGPRDDERIAEPTIYMHIHRRAGDGSFEYAGFDGTWNELADLIGNAERGFRRTYRPGDCSTLTDKEVGRTVHEDDEDETWEPTLDEMKADPNIEPTLDKARAFTPYEPDDDFFARIADDEPDVPWACED